MIQVSVCDPFNEEVFFPTDKVILAKHQDHLYAFGSFCGFDFSNLGQGAMIGNKVICPTCGSNYEIETGNVESGPNMRNLSTFPVKVRDG